MKPIIGWTFISSGTLKEIYNMDFQFKVYEKTPVKYPFDVNSSQVVYDKFRDLAKVDRECMVALYLNAKNKCIESEVVFAGTVDCSAVFPREILRSAIALGATSVIIMHNHPSGDPTPSEQDKDITKTMVYAAHAIKVNLLDHMVIGDNRYFSFADEGLIEDYTLEISKALTLSPPSIMDPSNNPKYGKPMPDPDPGTQYKLFQGEQ
jgi:DNA repair protein RadC